RGLRRRVRPPHAARNLHRQPCEQRPAPPQVPGRLAVRRRLRVDPTRCDGSGLCAELFPERVVLDDWGYPMIDPTPIDRRLEPDAKRAVAACPKLALLLAEDDS